MTRLVLVRHAEAEESRGDPPLSDRGNNQADCLRRRLRDTCELGKADRLVSSDLERALATASRIALTVGPAGLDIEPRSELREMAWGEGDGLAWDELVARYGIPVGKDHRMAPGAETWNEFEGRARAALREIVGAEPGSTAVVVCHTGVIEASFIEFGGLNRRSLRLAMRPRHASITTWVTAGDDPNRQVFRLEAYNDVGHLWDAGNLLHEDEDSELLVSGHEPFWAAIEGPSGS